MWNSVIQKSARILRPNPRPNTRPNPRPKLAPKLFEECPARFPRAKIPRQNRGSISSHQNQIRSNQFGAQFGPSIRRPTRSIDPLPFPPLPSPSSPPLPLPLLFPSPSPFPLPSPSPTFPFPLPPLPSLPLPFPLRRRSPPSALLPPLASELLGLSALQGTHPSHLATNVFGNKHSRHEHSRLNSVIENTIDTPRTMGMKTRGPAINMYVRFPPNSATTDFGQTPYSGPGDWLP